MDRLVVGRGNLKVLKVVRAIKQSVSFEQLLEKWRLFAIYLEISKVKIMELNRRVERETLCQEDVLHEILTVWRAEMGNKATMKLLCETLVECGVNDIAEFLENKFTLKFKIHKNVLKLNELFTSSLPERTFKRIYEEVIQHSEHEPIQIFNEQIAPPEQSQYYIPRTLSFTTEVNDKIFQDNSTINSLFLVKGISKYELAKLCGYQPVDVSGNQLDEITVRFMVWECDSDFDQICEKSDEPVHALEHHNGSYFWIKSSRKLKTIQRFLKDEKCTHSEIDIIKVNTNKVFCISDSPGMGKSFLLANMASNVQDNVPFSIALFVVLEEFAQRLTQHVESSTSALTAVANYVCTNKVATNIFKAMQSNSEYHFDLFLDAYDEVSQDKRQCVDAFLSHVVKLKNFRVFVTTRPHLRPHLEKVLHLLSHEILPFNKSNQIDFLTKYWTNKGAIKCEKLETYASKCLEMLRSHMTDSEEDIAGVPLQCRMLADVCGSAAEKVSTMDGYYTETIKINSLFDMYKSLVNLKFMRLPPDSKNYYSILSWFKQSERTNYINAHIYNSIALLFPHWVENFKPYLKGFDQVDMTTLYSIGLIEKSPLLKTPRFVHRTYAEYLLAEYLVENLSKLHECVELVFSVILGDQSIDEQGLNDTIDESAEEDSTEDEISSEATTDGDDEREEKSTVNKPELMDEESKLGTTRCGPENEASDTKKSDSEESDSGESNSEECDNITNESAHSKKSFNHPKPLKSRYPVIAYFINMHLKNQIVSIPTKQLALKLSKLRRKIETESFYKALMVCGSQDLEAAFDLTVELLKLTKYHSTPLSLIMVKDRYFKYLPHLIAERSTSVSLIRKIMDFTRQNYQTDLDFYTYDTRDDGSYSYPWIPGCTPLHVAAYFGKYNIVAYLIGEYGAQIKDLKYLLNTCVASSAGDSDSLIEDKLSILDALVTVAKKYELNWLNEPFKNRVPFLEESVHLRLLKRLVELGADINVCSVLGTVLHTSVCTQALVMWALSNGFHRINDSDNYGVTPLMKAVTMKVDLATVDVLYNAGANFNAEDKNGDSVLFHALRSGSKPLVSKVIYYGANVNHENAKKCNAAHILLSESRYEDSQEILNNINLLHLRGFNLLMEPDSEGVTPLSQLVMKKSKHLDNPQLMELFCSNVSNFSADDIYYKTLLFHTVGRISHATAQKIIEYGADVNYVNKKNQTVAHAAIKNAKESGMDMEVLKKTLNLLILNGFDKINHPDHYGNTPLHLAMELTSLDLLEFFHSNGANINAIDKDGSSVLLHAIKYNQTATFISKLLEYGADLHHLDLQRASALHIAADSRNLSALEFLVDKYDINFVDINGFTPLYGLFNLRSPLDPKLLNLFYENGANFNAVYVEGWSVILRAIEKNQNVNIIGKLQEYGADLYHQNAEKANALHIAAKNRNYSVLEFLIDKFDINSTDKYGWTPLHDLVSNDDPLNPTYLELFHLKGANFNVVDEDGYSVVLCAIEGNQNAKIIRKLQEYGADLYHQNSDKENALHIAAKNRNLSVLEFLIDKFDINSTDKYGWTPLHDLVANDEPLNPSYLELFHSKGANFNVVDENGYSVVLCAIEGNQSAEIIRKLVNYGADLYRLDSVKANALHFAAYHRNSSVLEFIIDKFDINAVDEKEKAPLHDLVSWEEALDIKLLDLFYKNGANFNAANKYGSVLFYAIRRNQNASIISKIIDYGADPFFLNYKNNNALMIAASHANSSALEFLLDKFEYDINAVNVDGHTPLHDIFSRKREDKHYRKVLELLLKKGFQFDIKNNKGHSPLAWWVSNLKNPLSTLIKHQDLLPITSEIASSALTALFQQNNLPKEYLINSSEKKKQVFQDFFNLLLNKGGQLLKKDGSTINWSKVTQQNLEAFDSITKNQLSYPHNMKTYKDTRAPRLESDSVDFSWIVRNANVRVEILMEGLLSTKQYELFVQFCSDLTNTEIL